MTIRQIGGVFGRHPSFQDVDTQNFTATGNVDLSGASPIAMGAVTGLLNVFRVSSAANIFEIERTGTGAGKTGMRQDGFLFTVDTNNDGIRWMRAGGEMARLRFGNLSVGTTDITNRLNIGGDIGLTGNVIVANGKGIDFSATSGTGTSELFDDYEEGTWTPAFGNLTVGDGTSSGSYTKIGDTVTIYGKLVLGSTTTVDGILSVTNLPFSAASGFGPNGLMRMADQGTATYFGMISIGTSSITLRNAVSSTSTLSSGGINATTPFTWVATDQLEFNAVYKAA